MKLLAKNGPWANSVLYIEGRYSLTMTFTLKAGRVKGYYESDGQGSAHWVNVV